jgi:autotransporter-associated beta strand protein
VAETSDKTINLAGAAGGHALINNKGPALLKFTTGLTATGAGAKTLYADQDVSNGVTEFAATIPDSSSVGTTAINKNGAGTLILSAVNTFTGGCTLKGGTLELRNAQSLAAGNVLTFPNSGTGSGRVKVAYAGVGSDLGNLLVQADATIDLGTDNTAQIRFGSATGWTAGKILTIANSTSGGKMYILSPTGLGLSQIKSLENPTWPASLDANGLLTFTSPTPTPPSSLSYANINGTVGTAIASVNPTVTGAVDSYSISPELPAGLSLNTSTGAISGTPSTAAASANYTVTATNAGGNSTATLTVAVVAAGSTYNSWLGAADPSDALLLQYAFGAVSPTQPLSQIYLPQGGVSGGSLVLTYYVRQGALGLNVVPELSENLAALGAGFAPSDTIIKKAHETIQVGGIDLQRRTASVLVEIGKPKKFLHLKVTQE